MKNKKMDSKKLRLNKMTISSLQSLKGGVALALEDQVADATQTSYCPPCWSINTRFTRIAHCC